MGQIGTLNTFTEGTKIESAKVNENFAAIKTAVNANLDDLNNTIDSQVGDAIADALLALPSKSTKCPIISCHRGGMYYMAENTLANFKIAEICGCAGIETDIQFSSDNIAFLMHDLGSDALRRTTNGVGSVSAFTAAELDAMDAGSYKTDYLYGCIYDGTTISASMGSSQCHNYGITYAYTKLDLTSAKYLYLGCPWTFRGISLGFDTVGAGYTLKIEYYNGVSWVDVADLDDNTVNFAISNSINWTEPDDWARATINAGNRYWIRISTTTTPSQNATLKYARNISDVNDCSNAGEKLPRLTEFLDWFQLSNLTYAFLDIKQCDNSTHADYITNAVEERNLENNVFFYCNTEAQIILLNASNPNIKRMWSTTVANALISTADVYGFLIEYTDFLANISDIETIVASGKKIAVWNIANTYSGTTGTGTTKLYNVCQKYANLVEYAYVDNPESNLLINGLINGEVLSNSLSDFNAPTIPASGLCYTLSGTTYTSHSLFATVPYTVLPNNSDYIYIGFYKDSDGLPYDNRIIFNIDTAGNNVNLEAEYLDNDGVWQSLSITDGTSNLTVDGTISFIKPEDWGWLSLVITVNSTVTAFFVRLKSSTTPVTPATCLITLYNGCSVLTTDNYSYIKDEINGASSNLNLSNQLDVIPGDIIRVSADFKTLSGSPGISIYDAVSVLGSRCFTEADKDSNNYRRYEAIALIDQGVTKKQVTLGGTSARVCETYIKNPLIEKISLPILNLAAHYSIPSDWEDANILKNQIISQLYSILDPSKISIFALFDIKTGTIITDRGLGGHNLTLSTDARNLAPSVYGQAQTLYLNGQTYTITNHADFNFGNGSSDSSFSTFSVFKPVSTSSAHHYIAKYDITTGAVKKDWVCKIEGSKLGLGLYDNSTGGALRAFSDTLSSSYTSAIHSFGTTYDGSSTFAGMGLNIDGTVVSTTDASLGSYTAMEGLTADIGNYIIDTDGSKTLPASYIYNSLLVYKDVLTATQIKQLDYLLRGAANTVA